MKWVPVRTPRDQLSFRHLPLRIGLRSGVFVAEDGEVGAVHAAQVAAAAFFRRDHVGRMVSLGIECRRERENLVGQNSTQKPQALQRSTTIETRPFAMKTPRVRVVEMPQLDPIMLRFRT